MVKGGGSQLGRKWRSKFSCLGWVLGRLTEICGEGLLAISCNGRRKARSLTMDQDDVWSWSSQRCSLRRFWRFARAEHVEGQVCFEGCLLGWADGLSILSNSLRGSLKVMLNTLMSLRAVAKWFEVVGARMCCNVARSVTCIVAVSTKESTISALLNK